MPFERASENEFSLQLWSLSKNDFNAWRRKNDLPQLLEFFKSMLPSFLEWQQAFAIKDIDFVGPEHTAQFFTGRGSRHLIDATGPGEGGEPTRSISVQLSPGPQWREAIIAAQPSVRIDVHSSKHFEPYFEWLRVRKKMHLFPIPGDLNREVTDDLRYSMWEGAPGRGSDLAYTRALLFKRHKVLKLGGATIISQRLDGRNLDFVDLDGLTVTGSGGSWWTTVAYSSCRGVSIQKAEKAFLTFERCDLEEFAVRDSRVQDLHFLDCKLGAPAFRDSRLNRCGFRRSAIGGLTIENCELLDFYFMDPPKRMPVQAREELYKRMRVAYQQKGDRREASHFYYLERLNELKGGLSPVIPMGLAPVRRGIISDFADSYERWRIGSHSTKQYVHLLRNTLLYYASVLFVPKRLLRLLARKVQFLAHVLDWCVWGFGERPAWVFRWMAAVVFGWTARYYFSQLGPLKGRLWESLSCSAFNFATIGCEYKTSFDSLNSLHSS